MNEEHTIQARKQKGMLCLIFVVLTDLSRQFNSVPEKYIPTETKSSYKICRK